MTPHDIIIRAEENIPTLLKERYWLDLDKVLEGFNQIETNIKGRSFEGFSTVEEHNRYVKRKADFLYVNYLKQGGMTKEERTAIDKNYNGWGMLRELSKLHKKEA